MKITTQKGDVMLTFARWVLTFASLFTLYYGVNLVVDAGKSLMLYSDLRVGPFTTVLAGVALTYLGLQYIFVAWGSAKDKKDDEP